MSFHKVTVSIGAETLPVLEGSLSLDSTRAPMITATLTVAATPDMLALDPQRTLIWATVETQVWNKRHMRIRDLSTLFTGKTLSDLSTLFTGKTLSEIPDSGPTNSWTLQVRGIRENWAADTVTLTLKSSEALILDFIQPGGNAATSTEMYQADLPTTSVLAAAQKIVSVCGLDAITDAHSRSSAAVSNVNKRWRRGIKAWDQLNLLLRDVRLVARPHGTTIKLVPDVDPVGTEIELTTTGAGRNILDGGQMIDRDAGDFATVIVAGKQPAPSSAPALDDVDRNYFYGIPTVVRVPTGTPGVTAKAEPPYKMLQVTDPVYAGWNRWLAPATNAFYRGRGWHMRAVSDYVTEPDALAHVDARGDTFDARVRSVSFSWPQNEMQVELVETYAPYSFSGAQYADQLARADWW